MGLWVSRLTEGTLCLALPCEGRAASALLQMSPRLGQSLCAGDGYEHSVPAWPCRSTEGRPEGHVHLFGATVLGRGGGGCHIISCHINKGTRA